MPTPLILMAGALGALLLFLVIWRGFSYLLSLPCPPGFIFILESRVMSMVAGPEALIARADIKPGMTVLDAGCGPGRLSIPVARYLGSEGRLVALDVQGEMLSRLEEKIASSKLANIVPILGGLGQGFLDGYSFDRALLVTVLGELHDQEAALQEIYRCLVPGGVLSVTELLPDPHFQSRRKVTRLAERVGFEVRPAHIGWRSFTYNLVKPAKKAIK
jgi:ubiquinone/menaquinone biosynthesis C-methylase UbiE